MPDSSLPHDSKPKVRARKWFWRSGGLEVWTKVVGLWEGDSFAQVSSKQFLLSWKTWAVAAEATS